MMNDMGTKWRQRKLCYLEKLFSERNADDCDAPEASKDGVYNGHKDAEKQQPDDIGN